MVHLVPALEPSEPRAELAVQRLIVIAHRRQFAALKQTLRPRRTHNHMPTRPYRLRDPLDISLAICIGVKGEHCPVVPTVKGIGWH